MGCITFSRGGEGEGKSRVDCNGLEMSAKLEMRVRWKGDKNGNLTYAHMQA